MLITFTQAQFWPNISSPRIPFWLVPCGQTGKEIPQMLKSAKPKVGECFYARKGPLLTLSWKEKKCLKNPCLMLTTGIGAGMVDHTCYNGQVKEFPKAVSSYNQHMGGVDLLDQMVDHVAGERVFHKFWKKCFFFFFNYWQDGVLLIHSVWAKFISPAQADTIPVHVHTNWGIVCILWGSGNRWCCSQCFTTQSCPSPRQERDCVVCSNRSIPGGRKRSRIHCEGCNVGVHLKRFPQLDHSTKREKEWHKLLQNTFLLGFFSIAVAVVYKVSLQSPEHETRLPFKNSKTNIYSMKIISVLLCNSYFL